MNLLTPSQYKKDLKKQGAFAGQTKKNQADVIIESTWYEDLATRTCYLYDYYHDNEPLKLNDLHPDERYKVPVDLKYIINGSQTMDKDVISQHIMFKPSEEGHYEMIPYYKQMFMDTYSAQFPVGLYCDIPDSKGKYNRWLIVDRANFNDPQFPTYEVLRCDYIFQWIWDGKKLQYPGVLRSQNSYNSGIWTDYITTAIEDQQKFAVPLTKETEHLWYNIRMIIDNNVQDELELRAWKITKVNRVAPNGVTRITLAQDYYDDHVDYVERDNDGKIIGKWCDYFKGGITPKNPEEFDPPVYCEVTCTGKPVLKMNDCYKTFSVNFFREGEELKFKTGKWSFAIVDRQAGSIQSFDEDTELISVLYPDDPNPKAKGLHENQIKVKFIGDTDYINWILVVTYTETEDDKKISSSLEVIISRL